jgi:hypothetical protein
MTASTSAASVTSTSPARAAAIGYSPRLGLLSSMTTALCCSAGASEWPNARATAMVASTVASRRFKTC